MRTFGDQRRADGRWHVRGGTPAHDAHARHRRLRPCSRPRPRHRHGGRAGIATSCHSHTWYRISPASSPSIAYGIPLVLTTHSLEPLRAWKREQLGGGYDVSHGWSAPRIDRGRRGHRRLGGHQGRRPARSSTCPPSASTSSTTASTSTSISRPRTPTRSTRYGVDPAVPYVLFVGRITRQKGIVHLVARHPLPRRRRSQVVLCAGAPDTPEIAAEMEAGGARRRAATARASSGSTRWSAAPRCIQLTPTPRVFCCPSVYEPFGIINLEAMACEHAGGGQRGRRHPRSRRRRRDRAAGPVRARRSGIRCEPLDPERFERDLADAINALMADPARARRWVRPVGCAPSSASAGRRSRRRPSISTRASCSGR